MKMPGPSLALPNLTRKGFRLAHLFIIKRKTLWLHCAPPDDFIDGCLPCVTLKSASAIVFSEPAQRSLTLWPARSPSRHATLYTESSDSFVASAAASIASGWSEPVHGRELHPLKSSAFHGALLPQLADGAALLPRSSRTIKAMKQYDSARHPGPMRLMRAGIIVAVAFVVLGLVGLPIAKWFLLGAVVLGAAVPLLLRFTRKEPNLIQTPALETKVAILWKVAEQEKVRLPTYVALHIPQNVRSNPTAADRRFVFCLLKTRHERKTSHVRHEVEVNMREIEREQLG